MSKKTQAKADTMFREAMAKQVQTMGSRPEGATVAVESGTTTLNPSAGTKQVYLRFVGVRLGVWFESMKTGPWAAHVADGVIVISAADKVELDHAQKSLETYSMASGLTVQVAEVCEGSQLGEWRPVDVSVWTPGELEPGTHKSREQLQAEVNRLHAERSPLVAKARAVRMEKGVTSPEFASAWFEVERLTRDLEEAEAARAKAGEADKAWRDATVDQPDDEITVLLRLASEGDEPLAVGHHADGTWWINGADPVALGLDVIGWMHVHEGAAILDHATRSAARGEVANG